MMNMEVTPSKQTENPFINEDNQADEEWYQERIKNTDQGGCEWKGSADTTKAISSDEWVEHRQAEGWCWFVGDERHISLWNHNTDIKTNIDAMYQWARADGIEKRQIAMPLEKRLPRIHGFQFDPSESEVFSKNGCTFRNKFKSQKDFASEALLLVSESEREDRVLTPNSHMQEFKEFIFRLTGCEEDKKWVTQWLAHMIQKPWERPSVHPLFRTQHGIGKNVLVERVMGKLLAHQTVTTSLKEIRNSHSESIANNILVLVDESKAKGMNVYLELKSMLTAGEMVINPKFVRPYKQRLYSRFMFADNTEGRAFSIEQEDRRIYVCSYVIHEQDKAETQEFIEGFLAWFEFSWCEVYEYLASYDISDWNPHVCPMTEAKRDYLDMCEDPVKGLIRGYKEAGWQSITELSWNNYMSKEDMDESYLWSALHTGVAFKFELEEEGFRSVRTTKTIDGKQHRINAWTLDGLTGVRGYNLVLKENSERRGDSIEGVSALGANYIV